VPKGKPFPEGEEEEKTTIESQWEDEASTTVEEGNVADKIRALGVEPRRGNNNNTGITGTGALDEHTVDDQRAQSAITPVRDIARLQITQGNDAGQEIEIRPGKTYTIGRAIDNDVVLTDIAVSRKHFDLRFEDGAWVIVDRGSGNGTVVNGNLEDNPFMLAHSDLIEIGNTVFRFDQPNAAARPERTVDLDRDDEEMSTVSGKPLRTELPEQPVAPVVRPQRPKTLPPPTPLRASTQPPPVYQPPPAMLPQPAPMPVPQMSRSVNLPGVAPSVAPHVAPNAPSMLGDQMQNGMPTAMPPTSMSQQRPIYAYPQATEIPPHSVHAQMLLIQTQNRRGDGSTAHVPPTPYDSLPSPIPRYLAPQLSRRTKIVLGGVGIAVLTAVLTIAIAKSGSGPTNKTSAKVTAKTDGDTVNAMAPTAPTPASADEPTNVTPTAKTDSAQMVAPTVGKAEPEAPTVENVEPKAVKTVESAKTATVEPAKTATVEVPKTEPKTEPVKTEPVKAVAKTTPAPKVVKTEPKAPKRERREVRRETPPPAPAPAPAPKRVATAGDPDAARNQADSLYRAKKFGEASSYLSSAAKKFAEEDAREMRRTSDMYAKLGRAMSLGTAPATKPTEAFESLRQAQNYDRNVGSAFDSEIQTKLAQVAPKAALSYFASKNYQQARSAVIAAQQFGSSESVKLVSQKLESVAGELYNEAMRELDSNPSGAREKFKQITTIVDSKSNWFQKAQKQLKGG
jgi:pSer/pThr/pTyr-binding forkhead associated (FHA) protein